MLNNVVFKTRNMILLINSWVIASGTPVAMLQHATSSQSIVFHQSQASQTTSSITTASPIISRSGEHQPKYEYKYEVSDHHTGDRKSHWEKRVGDSVRGAYTLYEPDGAQRTVEYTADAEHGFNAVVKRNEPSKLQQRHNNAYIHDMPSSSGHNGYGDSSIGHSSGRNSFSNHENESMRSETNNSFNHGVEFSVVHGHKSK